jgi:hypothetical protein
VRGKNGILARVLGARPRAWWFVALLGGAYLGGELPILWPALTGKYFWPQLTGQYQQLDFGLAAFCTGIIVFAMGQGLLCFPLGLWGLFVRDHQLLSSYHVFMIYVGWSAYLVLMAAGMQYRNRVIFWVLVVLMIMSAAGLPAEHIREFVYPSWM